MNVLYAQACTQVPSLKAIESINWQLDYLQTEILSRFSQIWAELALQRIPSHQSSQPKHSHPNL